VTDFSIWDQAKGIFLSPPRRLVGKDGLIYAFDTDEVSIARLRKEMAEKTITNIVWQ